MKKAKNPRKALLLISDGGDNSSRYSEAEIKALVKEADVQIYAIGIYESMGSRNRTPEETAGPALLSEIAEQTGGRQYQVDNLNELPDVAAKIGVELRNQYILGYSPQKRDSRRQVPPRPGQTGTTPRHAGLAAVLETGLLCARSIARVPTETGRPPGPSPILSTPNAPFLCAPITIAQSRTPQSVVPPLP